MADYTNLKAHYKAMRELLTEGELVVEAVAEKDAVLKKIEADAKKATTLLETTNGEIANAEKKLEELIEDIKGKKEKIDALDKYLASGFKAQEAEMKKEVEAYIAKLKVDGEATLSGLRADITAAEKTLAIKTSALDLKEKRLEEIDAELQAIKDKIPT